MKDIFGNPVRLKQIECKIYHDEREIPGKWLYHGFLFVPTDCQDGILTDLAEERKKSTWEKEIHFADLNNTRTMNDLARRWVELFCSSHYRSIYFYLFGVNYQNLAKDIWDDRKTRDFKIYNRFFQIGLYGAIKWFFLNKTAGFQKAIIKNIFSDAKNRTQQDPFHRKPISEIEFKATIKDEPIVIECSDIVEIDSNHETERTHRDESHLIQYIDLLTGGFSQVFDNTSKHEGKCKVANILVKNRLPKEIMGYDSTHFKSDYYKKCAVSFFPKTKLSKADILNKSIFTAQNQFHNERNLAFLSKDQRSLLGNG